MWQEVFFFRDGATESGSMLVTGTVQLDSVASLTGVAVGRLQLQSEAGRFVAVHPGQVLTLEELRTLCGPTAGTTDGSPIVVCPAPSAGEREPCSAELRNKRATGSCQSQKGQRPISFWQTNMAPCRVGRVAAPHC